MANGVRGPLRPNGGNSLMRSGALGDGGDTSRGGSPAEEVFVDHDGSRAARFSTELVGNRFRELQAARPAQREAAIRSGLIHDEENPRAFDDPILLKGTCRDMCPEYEREEREFKKNVDRWELRDGQAGQQGRIDPARAVSAFSRPAAGKDTGDEQVLPSDMRDPETLSRTLDYLFRTILTRPPHDTSIPPTPFNSLKATHPFIWDRTRQVRQEFSKQKHWGLEHAVSGHERVARYHILCLRELRNTGINLQQEAEQLRKTLVSLTHYYNDIRMDTGKDMSCPNEAEFRAYLLVLDMFDPETARATSVLPKAVFSQPILRLAFDLHALTQRNFDSQKAASRGNIQVAQNFASRFFKLVRSKRVPYVLACLLESRFADIRRAGLRALHQSYPKTEDPSKRMSIMALLKMFGCVNEDEVVEMCEKMEMEVIYEEEGPVGVMINRAAPYNDNRDPPAAKPWPSITAKQGGASYTDIINGVSGVQAGSGIPASFSTPVPMVSAPTAFGAGVSKPVGSAFSGFSEARPAAPASAFVTAPPMLPLQPSTRQPTALPATFQVQPQGALPVAPMPKPQAPAPNLTPAAPCIPTPPLALQTPAPRPRQPSPPPKETYFKEATAAAADKLVEDTVHELVRKIAQGVMREKEEEQARALQEARSHARGELLDHIAKELYHNMIAGSTQRAAHKALMQESRTRNLVRAVGRFWNHWARTQREEREERQRRRLAFSQRMEAMRHSRRLVSQDDVDMEEAEEKGDPGDLSIGLVTPEAVQAEELRKAQAERALFWEPGTYLEAIAQHISPLLPLSDHAESGGGGPSRLTWKVMVSATDQDTGKWLRRKLAVGKPPLHRDRGTFSAVSAPDIARSSRKSFASVGLLAFEVSRAALGSHEETAARHTDERQRFEALKPASDAGNEYLPSLLFVVWNGESLSAICQRLGVTERSSKRFSSIDVINLNGVVAEVTPLRQALIQSISRISLKPRFHLPLLPIVQAVHPLWAELMSLAATVTTRGVRDWLDFAVVLQLMLDSINDLRRVILTSIAPLYSGASLGVLKLPALSADLRIEDARSASAALLQYILSPNFAGMDDVALLVPDVREAIYRSADPPIRLVLENLAYAVCSRLAGHKLPLEMFLFGDDQARSVSDLCEQVQEMYSTMVISKMAIVEKLARTQEAGPPAPASEHADDVFFGTAEEDVAPIQALPDLSSASALQASPAASTTSKKRRMSALPDQNELDKSQEPQGNGRESKMMRLRRLMGEVKRDLVS